VDDCRAHSNAARTRHPRIGGDKRGPTIAGRGERVANGRGHAKKVLWGGRTRGRAVGNESGGLAVGKTKIRFFNNQKRVPFLGQMGVSNPGYQSSKTCFYHYTKIS
jgi:hypothetical protein